MWQIKLMKKKRDLRKGIDEISNLGDKSPVVSVSETVKR